MTCKGWGFIINCIVKMAVHYLLQAAAFVSISISHLQDQSQQNFLCWRKFTGCLSNVQYDSFQRRAGIMWTIYSYKTGDILAEKISLIIPEAEYCCFLGAGAGYFCISMQVKRNWSKSAMTTAANNICQIQINFSITLKILSQQRIRCLKRFCFE